MATVLKVWDGTAWVAKATKVWSGSAWVAKPVKVWNGSAWVGGSVVYADNFNRANAALEASPIASGGWSWIHDGAVASAALVSANTIRSNTADATGSAYSTPALPSANHYVQYKATIITSTNGFAACRLADRNNFIGIRTVTSGNVDVNRRVAGAFTTVYSSGVGVAAVGDVLRLEVIGNNFRVLQNGVEIKALTAIGAVFTATAAGFLMRANTSATFDDFEAGSL